MRRPPPAQHQTDIDETGQSIATVVYLWNVIERHHTCHLPQARGHETIRGAGPGEFSESRRRSERGLLVCLIPEHERAFEVPHTPQADSCDISDGVSQFLAGTALVLCEVVLQDVGAVDRVCLKHTVTTPPGKPVLEPLQTVVVGVAYQVPASRFPPAKGGRCPAIRAASRPSRGRTRSLGNTRQNVYARRAAQ